MDYMHDGQNGDERLAPLPPLSGEAMYRLSQEVQAELEDNLDFLGLRYVMPRYRYFQRDNGAMYCWTTERVDDGDFQSFVYRPVGKGSRSGKATEWELDEASISSSPLRKEAKARALRLFHEESQ